MIGSDRRVKLETIEMNPSSLLLYSQDMKYRRSRDMTKATCYLNRPRAISRNVTAFSVHYIIGIMHRYQVGPAKLA